MLTRSSSTCMREVIHQLVLIIKQMSKVAIVVLTSITQQQ